MIETDYFQIKNFRIQYKGTENLTFNLPILPILLCQDYGN